MSPRRLEGGRPPSKRRPWAALRAWVGAGGVIATTWGSAAEELRLSCPTGAFVLDAQTGAPLRAEDTTGRGPLFRGGSALWAIDGYQMSDASPTGAVFRHERAADGSWRLTFSNADAKAALVCTADTDGLVWRGEVAPLRGTMLAWRFPDRVEFDAADVDRFVFPDHLGLALLSRFFQPRGAGLEARALGPAGLRRVTGDSCRNRPWRHDSVPVRIPPEAEDWFPAWSRAAAPRWRVTANRCPEGDRHDLRLLETDHGSWLSGYRLGGRGWLFRFGGRCDGTDSRPQVASVIAVLSHLRHRRPEGPAARARIGWIEWRPDATAARHATPCGDTPPTTRPSDASRRRPNRSSLRPSAAAFY